MPPASRKSFCTRAVSDEGISGIFPPKCEGLGRYRSVCGKKVQESKHRTIQRAIHCREKKEASESCIAIPDYSSSSGSEELPQIPRPLRPNNIKREMDVAKQRTADAKQGQEGVANTIDNETLQKAIFCAVDAGNISIDDMNNTLLTTTGVGEFFETHETVLDNHLKNILEDKLRSGRVVSGAAQQAKVADQPFNLKQIAFCWARSKLRSAAEAKSVEKKKVAARAGMLRARELYLSKKAAGMTDPKEIMASIRVAMESESSPSESIPTRMQMDAKAKGCLPPFEGTNEPLRPVRETAASGRTKFDFSNDPPRPVSEPVLPARVANCGGNSDDSQPPGPYFWDLFRGRGQHLDAISTISPPLELPFPEERKIPAVESPPSILPSQHGRTHGNVSAAGEKSKKRQTSLHTRKTTLSESMARIGLDGPGTGHHGSKSPEKKQKGKRGVAVPIYRQKRKVPRTG